MTCEDALPSISLAQRSASSAVATVSVEPRRIEMSDASHPSPCSGNRRAPAGRRAGLGRRVRPLVVGEYLERRPAEMCKRAEQFAVPLCQGDLDLSDARRRTRGRDEEVARCTMASSNELMRKLEGEDPAETVSEEGVVRRNRRSRHLGHDVFQHLVEACHATARPSAFRARRARPARARARRRDDLSRRDRRCPIPPRARDSRASRAHPAARQTHDVLPLGHMRGFPQQSPLVASRRPKADAPPSRQAKRRG